MKRFLVFLFVVFGPMVGFGQTLRTTINGGILNQGNKGITATKLNNVLVTVADSVTAKLNKSGGVMSGSITAPSFVRSGGTSLQFLKADGSVDGSSFAILGSNNVYTGSNKFLNPIFINSTSSSLYSSISGVWNNTERNGIFSFRYNTPFGSNTVTWDPIRMNVNGQVGIGMNPTVGFEVLGDAKFNSGISTTSLSASGSLSAVGLVSAPNFASSAGANFATTSGNVGIGTTVPGSKLTVAGASGTSQISLVETGVRNYVIRSGGYGTNVFDIADLTAGGSRFVINSNGNVGINTGADAGHKLDINGSLRTVNDAYFATTTGNVGIGTVNPYSKLQITRSGLLGSYLRFDTGGNSGYDFNLDAAANLRLTYILLGSIYKELVTFDYTGRVGIGTAAPTSALQVVGLPVYADNAAATSGGLTAGAFYRTSTGVLMVRY
jgi:hypothetical protein